MENFELLHECRLQLEYLNEKFGETGTTNSLLSKLNQALHLHSVKEPCLVELPIVHNEDILKVADIERDAVTGKTLGWLTSGQFTSYKDQVLKEDLINIEDAIEEINQNPGCISKAVQKQVVKLKKLLDKNDCGYLRFIEH